MWLLITILGAVTNRIRGGMLTNLYYEYLISKGWQYRIAIETAESKLKTFSKHLNHFIFALVFTILLSPNNFIQTFWCLILLSLGMLGGSSFGWGNYIEAMISGKIDKNRTDEFISDKVLNYFASKPILAGFLALSVRGMVWTICICISLVIISTIGVNIPSKSYLIIPAGLLMGSCYLLAIKISEYLFDGVRGHGWQIGELIFGGYLWLIIYLLIK